MSDETPDLTNDEIENLRGMLRDYERSRWLGRLLWKTVVAVGAAVAGMAAFKDHIVRLFK
jgi:hypothetical protein